MSLLMVRKSATAHAAEDADNGFAFGLGEKVTFKRNGQNGRQWGQDAESLTADASEVQRVEKLLKRELTDAEFWKLGDYVMKHMKVGKTFTDNELLSAVKDSAASVDSNAEAIVNHDRIPVDQLGGEAKIGRAHV